MDDMLSIGLSNALVAALLALVAIAVGSVFRRPALVHGLWLLVLLKLVTPPLVRIPITWWPPPETASRNAVEPTSEILTSWDDRLLPLSPDEPRAVLVVPAPLLAAAEEESAADEPLTLAAVDPPPPPAPLDTTPWRQVLPAAWLAGSLSWFALAFIRLRRFRRLLRHARPAPAALQKRAIRLAGRLGLTRCPQVGLLPGRLAPMLWAVAGSPRLLVPVGLLDLLSEEQQDTLLVHELAHLRRRDHWVRLLEFLVMGLYWWHPVVWYARRELREAEEQCCDAWVVSTLAGAGRTYASALMDTLDFLSSAQPAVPLLASGLGQVSDLKRRLTMIMRGTTPRALSWPGCLAVAAVGAFFLPMLPALHAQAPRREDAKKETIKILVEDEAGKAELAKAKADLAALEAQLKMKMAEVEQAKAALGAAAKNLRLQRERTVKIGEAAEQYRKAVTARDEALKARRADEGKKSSMIRIEIILSPEDKDVNVRDLIKQIEKLLPEKSRGKVLFHAGDARNLGISGDRLYLNLRVPTNDPTTRPPEGGVRKITPEGRILIPLPPAEKRINELEKRLDQILKEMQELRREMKKPSPEANKIPSRERRPGVLYDGLQRK